jgi:hypothetical protein
VKTMEKKIEFKNIEELSTEEISELIRKNAPKPELVYINLDELKDK